MKIKVLEYQVEGKPRLDVHVSLMAAETVMGKVEEGMPKLAILSVRPRNDLIIEFADTSVLVALQKSLSNLLQETRRPSDEKDGQKPQLAAPCAEAKVWKKRMADFQAGLFDTSFGHFVRDEAATGHNAAKMMLCGFLQTRPWEEKGGET